MSQVQLWQIVSDAVLSVLRNAPREALDVLMGRINSNLNTPLRLYASNPSDSKLHIGAGPVEMGDGTALIIPPVDNTGNSFVDTTIDFQSGAVSGGTVTMQGIAFSLPATTVGQYRRMAMVFLSTGGVDTTFSDPAASVGALADYGVLFAQLSGQPIGYIDLEATASTAFKTIGSATAIIENKVGSSNRIFRVGAGSGGGSGTGDTTNVLETIKNTMVDSTYNLATPVVFKTDKATFVGSSVSGAYSVIDKAFLFSAVSGQFVSTNLFDPIEFLGAYRDCISVDVSAMWKAGKIDSAAQYLMSRDGGANYTPITMNRIGVGSETFQGSLVFPTEPTSSSLVTQVSGVGSYLLNNTTQQLLAQKVTLPAAAVVTQMVFDAQVSGTPEGYAWVSMVKDSAGLPSTNVADILCESGAMAVSGVSGGSWAVNLPATANVSGAVHFVVRTDDAYKAHYNATSGAHNLGLTFDAAANGLATNNGVSGWVDPGTQGLKYTVKGRTLDLRLKVISSAANVSLDGFGVFYDQTAPLQDAGTDPLYFRYDFKALADRATVNAGITLPWLPDSRLLECVEVRKGKVWVWPAFDLDGKKATFPTDFWFTGIEDDVTLIFRQLSAASDNNPVLSALLTANNLGSTDSSLDRSLGNPGKSGLWRNKAGVLMQVGLDENNNFVVLDT